MDSGVLAELMACEDEAFVTRAYWVLLSREPDPGGLVNYLNRLRAGASKEQILLELSASAEGKAKVPPGAESVAIVRDAKARTPPSTHAALGSLWSASSWNELVANHGRAFLNCAYQTLLGRAVDSDGLMYYEARLRAGASKVHVLYALRHSTEYRTRARLLRDLRRTLPQASRSERASAQTARSHYTDALTPTIDDVLAYDDENLVSYLCSLALGAGGEESQAQRDALARLRGGASPREVLRTVERSVTGRIRRRLLRRLDREIIKYFLARIPLLGRVLASVLVIDGDSPIEVRLRRIEYQLLGADEEVHRARELRAGMTVQDKLGNGSAGAAPVSAVAPWGSGGEMREATVAVDALRSLPAPADWGDE